jgi:isoleucyl-tRNA synthetase
MYTFAARSRERRSAQTAMYVIADGLTRLMAPIVSFTADELWRFLPGARASAGSPRPEHAEGREESVHMAVFPAASELQAWADAGLLAQWDALVAVRDAVLAKIEPLRKDKQIGSSLQARVVLTGPAAVLAPLQAHARALPMLFIVSEVDVRAAAGDAPLAVSIERARGVKCERCWRYVDAVSSDPAWAGLCERCQEALAETVNG